MANEIRMLGVEDSSTIAAIGYRAGTLRVRFKSGATYDYARFTPDALSEFLGAPSMGRYFSESIRGGYAVTRVDQPERVTSPEKPVAVVRRGPDGGRVPEGGCR